MPVEAGEGGFSSRSWEQSPADRKQQEKRELIPTGTRKQIQPDSWMSLEGDSSLWQSDKNLALLIPDSLISVLCETLSRKASYTVLVFWPTHCEIVNGELINWYCSKQLNLWEFVYTIMEKSITFTIVFWESKHSLKTEFFPIIFWDGFKTYPQTLWYSFYKTWSLITLHLNTSC